MTGCPEEFASVCDHRVTHLVGRDSPQLMRSSGARHPSRDDTRTSPTVAEVPGAGKIRFPPTGTSGLSRERALAILGQLVGALRELRRLRHQANNREQA